ncbi:cation:dicarboxylate symporter family transporter, partial [Daejeonella sp.]|uniref:cation:dicarboxylate symporter family transporter n=1 Tax=Daejeonella sp. TaxID=2805397 RepID=UPI003983B948
MRRVVSHLTFQVLLAIVIGVLVGLNFPGFAPPAKLISQTFIHMISMLIAPIIFLTIVLGIAQMGDRKKVGRVGASIWSRSSMQREKLFKNKMNMIIAKKLLLGLMMLYFTLTANAQQTSQAETLINIKGVGLQYDRVRFSVKPGEKIRLSLSNGDDMSHNLLITESGAREEVVSAALKMGGDGPKANYVPPGAKVLWFIPLIAPGETAAVSFTAPTVPGVYPFVCTVPGHGFVMFGAMYVGREMPPQKDDVNIPESRRT